METPCTDLVVPGQAVGAQSTASGISTLHVQAVQVKAAQRSGGVVDYPCGAEPGPGRLRQLACVSKASGAKLEGRTYPQCLSGSPGAQKLSAWCHRPPGEDGSYLYHERAQSSSLIMTKFEFIYSPPHIQLSSVVPSVRLTVDRLPTLTGFAGMLPMK